MAIVKPFKAIRPHSDKAADVAALPYDVYNRQEAKEEIKDKPLSFLRIDRAETTMDDSVDLYDASVYQKAKENLESFITEGALIQDEIPSFYLYELTMDGKSQTGLVASCSVDEYNDQTIKRHEMTRRDKEEDRVNHVDVLDANTGPIYLTYKKTKDTQDLIDEAKKAKAVYDFVSDDGIRHRVWTVDDPKLVKDLEKAFGGVENLYIADGHHRCASAARVANMRREQNPGYTGDEEFNYFLSVLFPSNELRILDYNRVVKDLNGLSVEEFLDKVKEHFEVTPSEKAVRPESKADFGMYLDGKWYDLKFKDEIPDDSVASLDVSILYDNILNPILGIEDPRTDKRIDFVGGIRGLKELERRANSDMKVAFSLYPTGIDELIEIADNERLMPPKSTWFEPKLRSGLFIHKLS